MPNTLVAVKGLKCKLITISIN